MSTYKRCGKRWTVNECLQLQREFELLQMPINEIAERHQRSPNSIMFKLDAEGFADYNVLYSNYHDLNSFIPVHGISEMDEDEHDVQHDVLDNGNTQNVAFTAEHIRQKMMQLEAQVQQLTKMLTKQTKNVSSFLM